MALKTVSVDSGTPEQIHARRNEMERHWPSTADPLDILLRWEARAFVVYNLDNYDDPVVDRVFISNYINRRLGDQSYGRIQRTKRNARPANGHGRNQRFQRTPDDWDCRIGTTTLGDAAGWNGSLGLVGQHEVLLEEKCQRFIPSCTLAGLHK